MAKRNLTREVSLGDMLLEFLGLCTGDRGKSIVNNELTIDAQEKEKDNDDNDILSLQGEPATPKSTLVIDIDEDEDGYSSSGFSDDPEEPTSPRELHNSDIESLPGYNSDGEENEGSPYYPEFVYLGNSNNGPPPLERVYYDSDVLYTYDDEKPADSNKGYESDSGSDSELSDSEDEVEVDKIESDLVQQEPDKGYYTEFLSEHRQSLNTCLKDLSIQGKIPHFDSLFSTLEEDKIIQPPSLIITGKTNKIQNLTISTGRPDTKQDNNQYENNAVLKIDYDDDYANNESISPLLIGVDSMDFMDDDSVF